MRRYIYWDTSILNVEFKEIDMFISIIFLDYVDSITFYEKFMKNFMNLIDWQSSLKP